MVPFDSNEYWSCTTWDRFREIDRVPEGVRKEFFNQEELTLSAVRARIAQGGNCSCPLNVIDIGCGTGRISKLLMSQFSGHVRVTLLDNNARTLDLAKCNLAQFENVDFVQASLYDIEKLTNKKYDIAICLDIFHHISDLESITKAIFSSLNPGGILIGNTFIEKTYKQWDIMKYGILGSFRRRSLNLLARSIYPFCPMSLKRYIRKQGLARIEPINTEIMKSLLNRHFGKVNYQEGYYLWFCANTPQAK